LEIEHVCLGFQGVNVISYVVVIVTVVVVHVLTQRRTVVDLHSGMRVTCAHMSYQQHGQLFGCVVLFNIMLLLSHLFP
jgi:hypothetical protein